MIPDRRVDAIALLRDSRRDSWVACFPNATFVERTINEAPISLAAVVPHAVVRNGTESRTLSDLCIDIAICSLVFAEAVAMVYFCIVI